VSAFLSQPFHDYRRASTDEAEAWALLHERVLRELRYRDHVHAESEPQVTSLSDFIDQWKDDVRAQYHAAGIHAADVIPLHGYSVRVDP
jgi:hypothetical protein